MNRRIEQAIVTIARFQREVIDRVYVPPEFGQLEVLRDKDAINELIYGNAFIVSFSSVITNKRGLKRSFDSRLKISRYDRDLAVDVVRRQVRNSLDRLLCELWDEPTIIETYR